MSPCYSYHGVIEMKLKVTIFCIFIMVQFLNALDMKLSKRITFSEDKTIIGGIYSFAVTEDGYFLLLDIVMNDIKIYSPEGKLEKVWGRKGPGPNEFLSPFICNYNDFNKNFYVMDFGKNRLIVLKREGKADFKQITEIIKIREAMKISSIDKDRLLIDGYHLGKESKSYELYIYNTVSGEKTFLLPSEIKYGMYSMNEYKSNMYKGKKVNYIGILGFSDFYGDNAYYVWEGDLRIIKINLKTKMINSFGYKTSNYKQPVCTSEMEKSKKEMNHKAYLSEKARMSCLCDVLANKNYVIVIYNKPRKDLNDQNSGFFFQFYKPDGTFIKEIGIKEDCIDMRFYLKKNSNELFCFMATPKIESNSDEEEYGDIHTMLKFKVTE